MYINDDTTSLILPLRHFRIYYLCYRTLAMKLTGVLYFHFHSCSNDDLLHLFSMGSVVEKLVDDQFESDDSSNDESSSLFENEK